MLYYIHGYESSPDGEKGRLFQKALHAQAIRYRDCAPEQLVIGDCLERISQAIKGDTDVVLIGSSLGGFLAAQTALKNHNVKKLVLLNPAIMPPETDLGTIPRLPRKMLEDMIEPRLFTEKLAAQTFIVRGTEDEVVPDDWVLSFAQAQEATMVLVADDHRLSGTLPQLPEMIASFLKKDC